MVAICPRSWLPAALLLAVVVGLAPSAAADEAAPATSPLVFVQRGEIPVIIAAPHGGRLEVPGVPARTNDQVQSFVTVRDESTDAVALLLAADLERRLGGKPYVVVARFDRRYVDANRPPEAAYESAAAAPHYRAYHDALESFCRDVLNRWRTGVLLDIHGQGGFPETVIRGTDNGRTVFRHIQRHGVAAFVGPESLFGRLAAAGLTVMPEVNSPEREYPKLDGGYTVRTYGSHQAAGLDAYQLELGKDLRRPDAAAEKTAGQIAQAVEHYCRDYFRAAAPTAATSGQPVRRPPPRATSPGGAKR